MEVEVNVVVLIAYQPKDLNTASTVNAAAGLVI